MLQEVPTSPEKRKVGFAAQASPSKRASVAEWLFGKSWAAAATGTAAAASQPVIPVAVAVEVVEPLAVVAAVPKRKVGFDAEVPPAKAAAGATPGLPFYSTAAAGSRRYVPGGQGGQTRLRAVRSRRRRSAPTAS